ncbi:hypothetical protein A6M27_20840 [Acidithiobacillus thiooxidans]|uniref:hypothetical protein n=2 Tax=Acidithiobacillus thiooxidans TaxID=930 RepID=UPI000466597A|nr:hypothetical protein [Acidithiobacillus thiooxidans]OCX69326.1 hypothetical protein A6O24_18705 [Acidithiobacillus thiooxidans]OCX79266.1 hypothetical protein A6O26_16920 [Acidithiobacillus thiooxidans]OCX80488.1 hypothetical protein A6M27_20840 [Acidithiobacillus thiooxidans]OFC48742.1 hypothetical protein BAE47_06890 [Acidithiobacillus thiooxidans]
MNTGASIEVVPLPDRALDWLTSTFGIERPVEFFTGMQDLGFLLSGSTALALLYFVLEDREPDYAPGDADFFPSRVASSQPLYTKQERTDKLLPLLTEHGFYPQKPCDHWALEVNKAKTVAMEWAIQGLPWEPAAPARPDTVKLSWDSKPKLQIMMQGLDGMSLPWDDFDLTVLRVALIYEDGFKVIMDRRVFKDFIERELIWNQKPLMLLKAVKRVKKYETRGFSLPESEKFRWNSWMAQAKPGLLYCGDAGESASDKRYWDQAYANPDDPSLAGEDDYEEIKINRSAVVDPGRVFSQVRDSMAEFKRLSQLVL